MSGAHNPNIDPAGESADTAGIPFTGRQVTSTGFDDDTGAADPALVAALESGNESDWVAALAESRLLVPIVAAPTEVYESGTLAVEKSTDMAVVTLTAPDGTKGLPVFSSLDDLARWDPKARPSPVRAAFAAQAAISEQCEVLLLDMASSHRVVVRASMLWSLAQQQAWLPAHEDPFVAKAVDAALVPEGNAVLGRRLEDAGEGVLRLRLQLTPGLAQEELQALATRVGERLAGDGETRARIEGLAFAFTAEELEV